MLSPETTAAIPDWVERKNAQWERIAGTIPGLQLLKTRRKTQYMIVCSLDGFYEGVIYGQLPEVHYVITGSSLKRRQRPAENHEKPFERRSIDLSDGQIDMILDRWREGRSALGLPFVDRVWSPHDPME